MKWEIGNRESKILSRGVLNPRLLYSLRLPITDFRFCMTLDRLTKLTPLLRQLVLINGAADITDEISS